jgi:hypothetical protein
MFPDKELVRGIQSELDEIIHLGVQNIVKLIHRTARLDHDKDIHVTTAKTAQVIALVNQPAASDHSPQIRSIIGLDEELDSPQVIKDKSSGTTLSLSTHKVLHSYLNALKTQAETRGHQFNATEDLIQQLIEKGLLSQRSVDKLEKQLGKFKDQEHQNKKKRDNNNVNTHSKKNKRK